MTRLPSLEQLDDLTERWHAGEGEGRTLREFLGLTRNQYAAWVVSGILPGTMPTSRNQREGFYMGHVDGRAVRRYAPLVPRPHAQFARAFRRGQLARRMARELGVPLVANRMLDGQGAL
jgi:hypothetical protein